MEKRAAKKVAGRKAMAMMATVFMDELSRLDASAIRRLASASSACVAESSCVSSAKSFWVCPPGVSLLAFIFIFISFPPLLGPRIVFGFIVYMY